MKTERYAIAVVDNRFAPEIDRARFIRDEATMETGNASDAILFEASEIRALFWNGWTCETNGLRYVRNGCASPDDWYVVPEETVDRIAARNEDLSLYDWDEYEGDLDDSEEYGRFCEQQDTALVREEGIDLDEFLKKSTED